jgi:hypothetical protein
MLFMSINLSLNGLLINKYDSLKSRTLLLQIKHLRSFKTRPSFARFTTHKSSKRYETIVLSLQTKKLLRWSSLQLAINIEDD